MFLLEEMPGTEAELAVFAVPGGIMVIALDFSDKRL